MGDTFQLTDEKWEWAKQTLPLGEMTATETQRAIEEHFCEAPNV